MKRKLSLLFLIGLFGSLQAQNEEDVLRYSYHTLIGTPRSLGMAGTMNTLGADLSVINGNPAGLGLYRQNTYLIGVGFNSWSTKSRYIGNETKANKSSLNIPNLGVSFTTLNKSRGKELTSGLVSYTLAFSLNRRNNLNQTMFYQGDNTSSSILDYFAERAYGTSGATLSSDINSVPGLAWNTYLINEDGNTPEEDYVANLPDSITMRQENSIKSSGRQNDLSAAFGINVSNRLYLGASLSLNTLKYEQSSVWKEKNTNFFADIHSMSYTSTFKSKGTGVSLQLGAILRITKFLRAGLHYNSGINYSITDNYMLEMSSDNFDPNKVYYASSDPGQFSYIIHVPARIGGGFSFIINNIGSFSAEIESVNYKQGKLSSNGYNYSYSNTRIQDNFQDAFNFKMGGEVLYGPYRFRAGYARFGSPLIPAVQNDYNLGTNCITGGLGYRNESGFFADFAVIHEKSQSFYTPYTLETTNRTTYSTVNTNSILRFAVSVGSLF